jgi:hypothetical protein
MTDALQSKVAFAHLSADNSVAVIKMQLPDGGQVEKSLDLVGTARLIHQLSDCLAVLGGAKSAPAPANEKYFQK